MIQAGYRSRRQGPDMSERTISIVIPNRNREAILGECLEAVYGSRYGSFDVVLVDDASTDGSLDIARRFPCTVVKNERCLGAAASRNAGARAAKGEILFFTDADVLLAPDALSRVNSDLEDDRIAGVIGLLSPSLRFGNLSSQYKNLYMHTTYMKLPAEVSVFYTSCAAIRRGVFEECGGFDVRYLSSGIEDMEFGERVTGGGHILGIDKGLQVEHVRHYSLRELLRTAFRRASGVTRIMLRRRFSRREKSTYMTSPLSFVSSIALCHLSVLLLVLGLLFRSRGCMGGALLLALSVVLLNAGLLKAIRRFNGWLQLVGSVPILFLDLYAHGLGNLGGLLGYMLGRRY